MVGLPWAADSCPWVGKLRSVLPLSDVIRDSAGGMPPWWHLELEVCTPAQPPPPRGGGGRVLAFPLALPALCTTVYISCPLARPATTSLQALLHIQNLFILFYAPASPAPPRATRAARTPARASADTPWTSFNPRKLGLGFNKTGQHLCFEF